MVVEPLPLMLLSGNSCESLCGKIGMERQTDDPFAHHYGAKYQEDCNNDDQMHSDVNPLLDRQLFLDVWLEDVQADDESNVIMAPTPMGGPGSSFNIVSNTSQVSITDCSWYQDQSMIDSILGVFHHEPISLFPQHQYDSSSDHHSQQRRHHQVSGDPTSLDGWEVASSPFVPGRLSTDRTATDDEHARLHQADTIPGISHVQLPELLKKTTSSLPRAVASSDTPNAVKSYQPDQTAWDQHFQDLLAFKQRHGHCRVPDRYPQNPSLAGWVRRQRSEYHNDLQQRRKVEEASIVSAAVPETARSPNAVSHERKAALLKIGFDFDPQRTKWEEKYKELVKFTKDHGHCKPTPRKNDPLSLRQLGIWVKCQRRHYTLFKEGKPSSMTLERIQRLNDIGFVWSPRTPKTKTPPQHPMSSSPKAK